MHQCRLALLSALLSALAACGDARSGRDEADDVAPDAGGDAHEHGDAGSDHLDGGGPIDAGPSDAGPSDAGPSDAGPIDAGPIDAGTAEPADAGAPLRVGSACTASSACPAGAAGRATCVTSWPDGYCVVDGCSSHGHDCPDDPGQDASVTSGSKCVKAPTARCLALCVSEADCRTGYACVAKTDAAGHGSAKVCFPR